MRVYGARGALALWCFTLVNPSMSHNDDGGRSGFLRGNPTARQLMSSSIDTTASIVGVGIYVPDDAADVLPTNTDNELVEELEDDDRVTVQSIQLGALLCDSLVNAENAPMLGFSLSPGEVLFANRTSYTVHNGSIFSDGISRKVWTGKVINDQEEVSSQTASMTWGEQCDVETFLLEIPKRFVNGTLIVAKTLPCLEGGELDMCIVELEIDLPDEAGSELEDTEGDTRQLRDRQDLDLHVNTTGEAIAPVERHLQSTTTQIDLMFVYTPEARDILLVSDSQMQSELADSVTTINEAMVNSNIDLQFSLVRVEPLPYTEESIASSVVLGNLQASSDVAELRDTYGADLVHLVADLNAGNGGPSCGIANLAAEPNEDAAFGVVDPYCFFQFSHTHEIAHNMGCYHNRDNSVTQHEYAHGYRYCDGDLPYRTIMSYACTDENGQRVPRENYFSNPDVIFNDRPTGTTEDNCARRLTETMGDVANYRESTTVAITPAPTAPITPAPTAPITPAPTTPITPAPTALITPAPTAPITPAPTTPITPAPTALITPAPTAPIPITPAPTALITPAPTTPITPAPTAPIPITPAPTTPITPAPTTLITPAPTAPIPISPAPTTPITPAPTALITPAPTAPIPITPAPTTPITPTSTTPITPAPTAPITPAPTTPITPAPTVPITPAPTAPITPAPTTPITPTPTTPITPAPTAPITPAPTILITSTPTAPITLAPTIPITSAPTDPITPAPTIPITSAPTDPITLAPTIPITSAPTDPIMPASMTLITPVPTAQITPAPTIPITPAPTLAPALNVVTVSTSMGPTTGPTTCSNGITGVERNGYCCPVGCGTCGGFGCSQRAREAGLTSENCCVSRIEESGIYCDDSGTAPCIFGTAPTPTLGSVTPVPTSVIPTAALEPATPIPTSLRPSAAPESATPSPISLAPTATLELGVSQPVATPTMAEFVEVGERTTVVVSANAFDERILDSGCSPDGCVAANTRDGSLDTRWSCKESLLGGANCDITYEFGEPQDLDMIRVAFYKGAERTRRLKIKIDGFSFSEVESSGQIDDFEDFVLGVSGASEVVLEALGLGSHDWISLTEVQFILS